MLSEITSVITKGTTPTSVGCSFSKNGINYIKSESITSSRTLDKSKYAFISEETHQKLKRSQIKENDILFSMAGMFLGKTGIVQADDVPANTNQAVAIIRIVPEQANYLYVYYYLNQKNIVTWINSLSGQSAQPNINLKQIGEIEIPLPDRIIQDTIVEMLSAIDSRIELNTAINENLEQQAQAIYAQMFIESAEESWETGSLSDIAVITMGQSPKGDTFNETGEGAVFYQGRTDFGFRFPTRRLYTTEPKRIALCGDALMSVRAPVGDLNVAYEECCIGRGLAAIHSKDNHQSFVLYTLFTLKKQLDVFNGEGTVFGSINKESLNSMEITIPPRELMDRFESTVSPIDRAIRNNYEEICRLQAIRDTLLPKLMNGEIDVSAVKI
ncbi:restriction endonuclease subunit S [Ruminococcus sp. AF34-12]|nr:restriction endonuclease subunit S [Ruminococcus sp. AF34-12]